MNPLDLVREIRALGHDVTSVDGELSVEPSSRQDVYPIPPDTLDKVELMESELLAVLHREAWLTSLVKRVGEIRGYYLYEQDEQIADALRNQAQSCSRYVIEAQFLCERFGQYLPDVLFNEVE